MLTRGGHRICWRLKNEAKREAGGEAALPCEPREIHGRTGAHDRLNALDGAQVTHLDFTHLLRICEKGILPAVKLRSRTEWEMSRPRGRREREREREGDISRGVLLVRAPGVAPS